MFKTNGSFFHSLDIENCPLPKAFTFPFNYQPHVLSRMASEEVQQYLNIQTDFNHNFSLYDEDTIGKMFGVLIVRKNNEIGYLAAFSGKIDEQNHLIGFVPPVFDTLNPDGFYKKGESQLDDINAQVHKLEKSKSILLLERDLHILKSEADNEIRNLKSKIKQEKLKRDQLRLNLQKDLNISEEEKNLKLEILKNESIQYNYSLKDLKRTNNKKIEALSAKLIEAKNPLEDLKTKRKLFSAELQKRLHESYSFLNANGELKNLTDIFSDQPPAAAGECAAPKLLQYAYANSFEPLAMAEFWWGKSPNSQIRKHKQFYPSCRSKCEPILGHMLQGLEVEANPLEEVKEEAEDLEIIHEDQSIIIVNKPIGLLSVPGKTISDSVLTRVKAKFPKAKDPLLVHRLDRATSGILVVAKNLKTYRNLQEQFIQKTVQKQYVAILDGEITDSSGTIDLPLRVDLDNRPQQLVCYKHGKSAKTEYKVVEIKANKTRINFYPITGRTHQLRVHAAHQMGLNTPILGDDLYGIPKERLYLHAETISFQHPITNKLVSFNAECPF